MQIAMGILIRTEPEGIGIRQAIAGNVSGGSALRRLALRHIIWSLLYNTALPNRPNGSGQDTPSHGKFGPPQPIVSGHPPRRPTDQRKVGNVRHHQIHKECIRGVGIGRQ